MHTVALAVSAVLTLGSIILVIMSSLSSSSATLDGSSVSGPSWVGPSYYCSSLETALPGFTPTTNYTIICAVSSSIGSGSTGITASISCGFTVLPMLVNIVFVIVSLVVVVIVGIKKDGGFIKLVAGAAGLLGVVAAVIDFASIASAGCPSAPSSFTSALPSGASYSQGTTLYVIAAVVILLAGLGNLAVAAGAHMKKVGGDAATA